MLWVATMYLLYIQSMADMVCLDSTFIVLCDWLYTILIKIQYIRHPHFQTD